MSTPSPKKADTATAGRRSSSAAGTSGRVRPKKTTPKKTTLKESVPKESESKESAFTESASGTATGTAAADTDQRRTRAITVRVPFLTARFEVGRRAAHAGSHHPFGLPSPGKTAYYLGLGVLAAGEVIEWPVAAAIAAGTYTAQHTRKDAPAVPRADVHLPGVHLPGSHLPDLHLPGLHLPGLHRPESRGPGSHPTGSQDGHGTSREDRREERAVDRV